MLASVNFKAAPLTSCCAIGPATAPIRNNAVLSVYLQRIRVIIVETDESLLWQERLSGRMLGQWRLLSSKPSIQIPRPSRNLQSSILTEVSMPRSTLRPANDFKIAPAASN